jgi:hypothetical protein
LQRAPTAASAIGVARRRRVILHFNGSGTSPEDAPATAPTRGRIETILLLRPGWLAGAEERGWRRWPAGATDGEGGRRRHQPHRKQLTRRRCDRSCPSLNVGGKRSRAVDRWETAPFVWFGFVCGESWSREGRRLWPPNFCFKTQSTSLREALSSQNAKPKPKPKPKQQQQQQQVQHLLSFIRRLTTRILTRSHPSPFAERGRKHKAKTASLASLRARTYKHTTKQNPSCVHEQSNRARAPSIPMRPRRRHA